MTHLAESTVIALVRGELDEPAREAADAHIDACSECLALVAAFGRGQRPSATPTQSTSVERPRDSGAHAPVPSRGALIDRYVVLEPLGAGGMGVVVAALDPDLARKVAIKLIRPGRTGTDAHVRLVREAQALAKVSARNVVTVFDVGTHDDSVFVAMELVDGDTLAHHLAQTKPPWREIVRLFGEAAHGLAAIHAAGLVHRDVKPGNIMIAKDGRVVVMDLGLARWQDDAVPIDAELEHAPRDAALTVTGAVLGTPAYMSPEQHEGAPADARSDQFSFCVALWQALYGELPFAGDTLHAIAASVTAGELRAPPAGTRVPDRIRRALTRGLARAPDQRWPSIAALVSALERDPARRVARVALWSAPIAVVAAIAWSGRGSAREDPCAAATTTLAEVWSADKADALAHHFAEIAGARGAELASGVIARLDAHAEAHGAAWRDACEATHVRGEQSSALFDRRMRCLDRKRATLAALVDAWTTTRDGAAIDRASTASHDLPRVAECSDTEALEAAVPLPDDATLRGRIEAAIARLDESFALQQTGRFREALAIAESVAVETTDIGHPPLTTETQLRIGLAQLNLGEPAAADAMWAAMDAAAAAHDDLAHARAAVVLVGIEASMTRRFEAADTLTKVAGAAVHRADDDPMLRALLFEYEGRLHEAKGELELARAAHEQALAIRLETFGDAHPYVASALQSLGRVAYREGRYDDAESHWARALTVLEAAHGARHPDVASAMNNLGVIRHTRGDPTGARSYYERALAIEEDVFGPTSDEVANALGNLGILAEERSEPVVALALHERALAVRRAAGVDPLDVARSLHSVGVARDLLGDREGARASYEEAIAAFERERGGSERDVARVLVSLGPAQSELGDPAAGRATLERAIAFYVADPTGDPVDLAIARAGLAEVLLAANAPTEALAAITQAREVFVASLGENHPHVAATLSIEGDILLAQARRDEAIAVLERALAAVEAPERDPQLRARIRMSLARALHLVDRERAVDLARHAAHALAVAGPGQWGAWAKANAWLAEHA